MGQDPYQFTVRYQQRIPGCLILPRRGVWYSAGCAVMNIPRGGRSMRRPYAWLRHAQIVAQFGRLSKLYNSFFSRGDDERRTSLGHRCSRILTSFHSKLAPREAPGSTRRGANEPARCVHASSKKRPDRKLEISPCAEQFCRRKRSRFNPTELPRTAIKGRELRSSRQTARTFYMI
jgi:hypothetical protein